MSSPSVTPRPRTIDHIISSDPVVRLRDVGSLKGRWIDLLRDGDRAGRYATDRDAAWAFALAAHRAGWTTADYVDAMLNPRNELHRAYRHRDGRRRHDGDVHRNIVAHWSKAVAWAKSHPVATSNADTQVYLDDIRDAIDRGPWRGATAARNRIVLLALHKAAQRRSTLTPTRSLRTLCEDTPYAGLTTIVRALDALESAGWISRERDGMSAGQPTAYRLHVPKSREGEDVYCTVSAAERAGRRDAVNPLTVPRSVDVPLALVLGVHAAAIYAAMDGDSGQSMGSVIRRSGITRNTVRKWLPRLARRGLARESSDGWVRGDTDPGVVAIDLDVLEVMDKRVERHQKQRDGWEAWCAERAADVAVSRSRGPRRARS